jgi:hypothetical protein
MKVLVKYKATIVIERETDEIIDGHNNCEACQNLFVANEREVEELLRAVPQFDSRQSIINYGLEIENAETGLLYYED